MTDAPPILDEASFDAIAALVPRCVDDIPDPRSLRNALFGTGSGPPAVVRGDPSTGVVASVVRHGAGFIRLLVVAREARRRGLGASLLAAAEEDLRAAGVERVRVGTDAPDYLWPGIDVAEIGMLCLVERARYRRVEATYNMAVDLRRLPLAAPSSAAAAPAQPSDRVEVKAWAETHWPNWADEVLRALDNGSLMISRDEDGLTGFCAYDVARANWLGPIAVHPQARNRGTGTPLLLAALHAMRDAGRDRAEIAWVGPIGFYADVVGATICRTYAVVEKRLKPAT